MLQQTLIWSLLKSLNQGCTFHFEYVFTTGSSKSRCFRQDVISLFFPTPDCLSFNTLPTVDILRGKNVRAWVSKDFTQDKFSAPIAIEKIKILGAPWELLAKQHCQSSPFTSNLGQIGQIGSAV